VSGRVGRLGDNDPSAAALIGGPPRRNAEEAGGQPPVAVAVSGRYFRSGRRRARDRGCALGRGKLCTRTCPPCRQTDTPGLVGHEGDLEPRVANGQRILYTLEHVAAVSSGRVLETPCSPVPRWCWRSCVILVGPARTLYWAKRPLSLLGSCRSVAHYRLGRMSMSRISVRVSGPVAPNSSLGLVNPPNSLGPIIYGCCVADASLRMGSYPRVTRSEGANVG
jgi:hypothetical protein